MGDGRRKMGDGRFWWETGDGWGETRSWWLDVVCKSWAREERQVNHADPSRLAMGGSSVVKVWWSRRTGEMGDGGR